MRLRVKRRALLAASPWPLLTRVPEGLARQAATPVVGYVSITSPETAATGLAAFHDGLREAGYVEGRNVAIEYAWAEGHYDRLPAMIGEFIARKVAVLVAIGGPAARAASQATSSVPIVFQSGGDAVALGLVDSLGRPGRNATGVSLNVAGLGPKRLELLGALVPNLKSVALLSDPGASPLELPEVRNAAASMGLSLHVEEARGAADIEPAFARLARVRPSAILVGSSLPFLVRRTQIVALAAQLAIPAIYEIATYVSDGGLISYGPSIPGAIRPIGVYTGKILAGAEPADLPVQQPTKFELVINLKIARALGLTIPLSLLARADEVIE